MTVTLAELRAAPRDMERLTVYADRLQALGHPRGELIALSLLAERSTQAQTYQTAQARARALALADATGLLLPPTPGSADASPRGLWASWSRGFIDALEVRIDGPSPRAVGLSDGPQGWAELLQALLEHPSLALLERLVIRVEDPSDPAAQCALALRTLLDGLAPYLARARLLPGPHLHVDLWTSALPSADDRSRAAEQLRALSFRWFSWDLTMIPPPGGHAAAQLIAQLANLGRADTPRDSEDSVAFDMLWFDTRSQFLARLDARSGVVGGVEYDMTWSMHLRGLAETAAGFGDALFERRAGQVFSRLAPRFMPQRAQLAPAAPLPFAPTRDPHAPPTAEHPEHSVHQRLARFAQLGIDAAHLAPSLESFDPGMRWRWLEQPCGKHDWRGFVGLGHEDVLVLALLSPDTNASASARP